jgi:hypothetical protein
MTRRHRLTDDGVAKLKAKAKRYTHADPELPGHYVRVQPNGAKSFVVVSRDPRGKQHWRTVGAPPMKIDDTREIARKTIRSIREAPPDSFEGVAREWFKRHVVKNKLRSAGAVHEPTPVRRMAGTRPVLDQACGRGEASRSDRGKTVKRTEMQP